MKDYTYSFYVPSKYTNYHFYYYNIGYNDGLYFDFSSVVHRNSDFIILGKNTKCTIRPHHTNEDDFVVVYPDYPGLVDEIYVSNNTDNTIGLNSYDTDIKLTNDIFARSDIDKISVTCFCFIFLIVFIFNTITRFIKKGGLLSA